MCGRVFVKSSAARLMEKFTLASRQQGDGLEGFPPRYNGAPGLFYPLIVREPDTQGGMFISARWGLIPHWMKDAKGGPKPINAKAETVAEKPMFRAAYKARRALMPIDGFFEWQAVQGARVKQPYAIAMQDGEPFALAAIQESWRHPETGEEIRTFAVLTCEPNALMAEIHNRMPVIVAPADYARWIGTEANPSDLLRPYPAARMKIWPISRRVNNPANDDAFILDLSSET